MSDNIIDLDLYFDQANRKLVDSGGSALTLAPVTRGGTLQCTLRNLVQDAAGDRAEADLPVRSFRASVGNVMTAPASGTFKFRRTYLVDGVSTVDLSLEIVATANAADFAIACATTFGQCTAIN